MSTPHNSQFERPRKRVRKGTHSCIACKRRKVRCIFSYSQTTCLSCLTRGVECVSQRFARDFGENGLEIQKLTSRSPSDDRNSSNESLNEPNAAVEPVADRVVRLEKLVESLIDTSKNGQRKTKLQSLVAERNIVKDDKHPDDDLAYADDNLDMMGTKNSLMSLIKDRLVSLKRQTWNHKY
jgi:hypothetical protein